MVLLSAASAHRDPQGRALTCGAAYRQRSQLIKTLLAELSRVVQLHPGLLVSTALHPSSCMQVWAYLGCRFLGGSSTSSFFGRSVYLYHGFVLAPFVALTLCPYEVALV